MLNIDYEKTNCMNCLYEKNNKCIYELHVRLKGSVSQKINCPLTYCNLWTPKYEQLQMNFEEKMS